MSSNRFGLALVATCACALAGCNTGPIGSRDPGFGEAPKYNAAVQTVDPDPVYGANDALPGASGVKGVAAVKRYRTDAVKDVQVMETTGSTSSPH